MHWNRSKGKWYTRRLGLWEVHIKDKGDGQVHLIWLSDRAGSCG